jgi:hypothetical protein
VKLYKGRDVIISDMEEASGFIKRLTGLIGRKKITPGYGLYFPRCNSIHTFFMSCRLDVIMISNQGRVEGIFEGLAPWKLAFIPEAADTIETVPGTVRLCGIKTGDILSIRQ